MSFLSFLLFLPSIMGLTTGSLPGFETCTLQTPPYQGITGHVYLVSPGNNDSLVEATIDPAASALWILSEANGPHNIKLQDNSTRNFMGYNESPVDGTPIAVRGAQITWDIYPEGLGMYSLWVPGADKPGLALTVDYASKKLSDSGLTIPMSLSSNPKENELLIFRPVQ